MDITEAEVRRNKLVKEVTDLVQQFEWETGLTVQDIRLDRVDLRASNVSPRTRLVDHQPIITIKVGLS